MYFARYFISPARLASLIMVGLLSACAMVPPEPVVTGPVTAPPPPVEPPQALANGSIYQPTAYGNYPLFEDRRPRNIGDVVTILKQWIRSEEHTSELQSRGHLVCRLLLE